MIGRLEEGVLAAVNGADGEPTTTQIHEALSPIFDKASLGAMYVTLERLERKGLLSRRRGEPTRERGGKAQNFYTIKAAGKEALQKATLLNAAVAILARLPAQPKKPPAPRRRFGRTPKN